MRGPPDLPAFLGRAIASPGTTRGRRRGCTAADMGRYRQVREDRRRALVERGAAHQAPREDLDPLRAGPRGFAPGSGGRGAGGPRRPQGGDLRGVPSGWRLRGTDGYGGGPRLRAPVRGAARRQSVGRGQSRRRRVVPRALPRGLKGIRRPGAGRRDNPALEGTTSNTLPGGARDLARPGGPQQFAL